MRENFIPPHGRRITRSLFLAKKAAESMSTRNSAVKGVIVRAKPLLSLVRGSDAKGRSTLEFQSEFQSAQDAQTESLLVHTSSGKASGRMPGPLPKLTLVRSESSRDALLSRSRGMGSENSKEEILSGLADCRDALQEPVHIPGSEAIGMMAGLEDRRVRAQAHLRAAGAIIGETSEDGRLLSWLLEDCAEVLERELMMSSADSEPRESQFGL